MNVALSELPRFTSLPEPGDHLTAGIIMAPSLDYMDRAYTSARTEGWSREPIIEMLIPSTLDDSLAPPGQHVASLFCQHFPYEVEGGWEARVDEAADHIIAHVDRYAPGFKASVLGRLALSPWTSSSASASRRRHLPRQDGPRPALLGPADARPRRLPDAAGGPLSVRLRRASRRRRDGRAGAQCGQGDAGGPEEVAALT